MPEIIVLLEDRETQRLMFDTDQIMIGRSRDNDVVIDNLSVSRHHARIEAEDGRFFISDLDSANGTYVNKVRVTRSQIFHDDMVTIGKHQLRFLMTEGADAQPGSSEIQETMVMDKRDWTATLTVQTPRQRTASYELDQPAVLVGRSPEAGIRVVDWFVDMRQARIERGPDGYVLCPLGDTAPTLVNGQALDDDHALQDGDVVELGVSQMVFSASATGATPTPVASSMEDTGFEQAVEAESAGAHDETDEDVSEQPAVEAAIEGAAPDEAEDVAAAGAEMQDASDLESVDFEMAGEAEAPLAGEEIDIEPQAAPTPQAEAEAETYDEVEADLMAEIEGGEPEAEGEGLRERIAESVAEQAPEAMAGEGETPEEEAALAPDEAPSDFEDLMDEEVSLAPEAPEASTDEAELETGPGGEQEAAAPTPESAEEAESPELQILEAWNPEDQGALAPHEAPSDVEDLVDEEVSLAPEAPEASTDEAELETGPGGEEEAAAATPDTPAEGKQPGAEEIAIWEKALENPSAFVRRQAARKLKELTGCDYDV